MYYFFSILLQLSIYSRPLFPQVCSKTFWLQLNHQGIYYLFLFLQVESHVSFIGFPQTLVRCGQNLNSGCNQNGTVGRGGRQQQQQIGDGRPEFDGEQMCAEPCNVKGCELIHNSCGRRALVTTSQQAEFRLASGEHGATGSGS